MTNTVVQEIVTTALGLSGPEALALKLGAMVVSEVLRRPQNASGRDSNVLSSTPGRARIAADGLKGSARLARRIEERLGHLPGVEKVSASPITGTVLVTFDEDTIGVDEVSRAVRMAGMALRVERPDPLYRLPSTTPLTDTEAVLA